MIFSFCSCGTTKSKLDPYSIYAGTYYNQNISWYSINKLNGKPEDVAPKTQDVLELNNDGTGYYFVKVVQEDYLGLLKAGTIVMESTNLTWRVESGKIITNCKVHYLIDRDTGAKRTELFDIEDNKEYIIDGDKFYLEGSSVNTFTKEP